MHEMEPRLLSYLYFFNVQQDYFECHEYLESLWLDTGRPQILQGLIQAAVCLYHLHNGNIRGALRMWDRGRPRLRAAEPAYNRIDLTDLIEQINTVLSRIPEELRLSTVTPREVSRLDLPTVTIRFTDAQMDDVVKNWVPDPLPEED